LIRNRVGPGREVGPSGDEDLVEDVVVEIVLVRSDARFLMGIDPEGDLQEFLAAALGQERIDVGGVGGRVEGDERGIHVTRGEQGRHRRSRQSEGEQAGKARAFHSEGEDFIMLVLVSNEGSGWDREVPV
jgi:hypothetical protein